MSFVAFAITLFLVMHISLSATRKRSVQTVGGGPMGKTLRETLAELNITPRRELVIREPPCYWCATSAEAAIIEHIVNGGLVTWDELN